MKKIKGITVFIDMDGVIADFEGAVRDKLGLDLNTAHKGKVWSAIKNHNETVEPWFYSLPKLSDADTLWNFVTSNFSDVQVLTASGSTPKDAGGQKKAWVGEHFGYDTKVIVVGAAKEKANFATEHSILIDDRNAAIDPFINAGGIGILHTSASNTIATLKIMMEDM